MADDMSLGARLVSGRSVALARRDAAERAAALAAARALIAATTDAVKEGVAARMKKCFDCIERGEPFPGADQGRPWMSTDADGRVHLLGHVTVGDANRIDSLEDSLAVHGVTPTEIDPACPGTLTLFDVVRQSVAAALRTEHLEVVGWKAGTNFLVSSVDFEVASMPPVSK